jgi:hypothetical protein
MTTPLPPRSCIVCGAPFQPVSSKHLHCSVKCVGGQPQPRRATNTKGRSQFFQKNKKLLIASSVAGGVLLLGIAGLLALTPAGDAISNSSYDPYKPYPREVFKTLVGKTAKEVWAEVGEPDAMADFGGVNETWLYTKRAIDTQTNKEGNAKVKFKSGRVTEVTFH